MSEIQIQDSHPYSIHTCMHTYIHADRQADRRTHIHIFICIYIFTQMQTHLNDPDCTRQVQVGMSFMSFIYVQKALSSIILSRTAQRPSPAQASRNLSDPDA